MPYRLSDLMTRTVRSVKADEPLLDVQWLFVEQGFHGAPVVDDGDRLIGVISTSDLLRAATAELEPVPDTEAYLRDLVEFAAVFSDPKNRPELSDLQERLAHQTVADFMTRDVVSVPEETPVAEVARLLREHQIHRVWVVNEGRVSGVVSTFDLLPVIEELAGSA